MAYLLAIYGNRGSEPNFEKGEFYILYVMCIEAVLTTKKRELKKFAL